jgi:hypothetical protein
MIRFTWTFQALLVAVLFLIPATEVLAQAPDAPPPPTAEKEAGTDAPRVVPDPMTPPQNTPSPQGGAPSLWTSWTSGQVVIRSDRVSITLAMGGLLGTSGEGAEGFDDNAYDVMFKPSFMGYAELGFTLMPCLNFSLGAAFQILLPDHPRNSWARFETSELTSGQFYLATRFKLPLALLGSRLFSISKAESGKGFVPYVKLSLGLATLSKATIDIPSAGLWDEPMYEASKGFYFGLGLGLEGRWRLFGLFVELSLHRLGEPKLAPSVTWSIDTLITYTFAVGMAFYI